MRVIVTIEEEQIEGDYGVLVDGLRLTCPRCGYEATPFGTGESSAKAGAVMLREECPNGESNYYDISGWV